MPKKPEEIRAELARNGVSLAAWARSHGFSESLTYRVMRGQPACLGQSHQIAVALGLKEGGTAEVHEINFSHNSDEAAAPSFNKQIPDGS